MAAREIQQARFRGAAVTCNAAMGSSDVARHCALDDGSSRMLKAAFEKKKLSARSYDRILKVARTIADLAGREEIGREHLAQALNYRELDKVIP